MAEIVNLRRERKRAERRKDAAQAESNRILFGRTKSEKSLERLEKQKAERHLDGAEIDKNMKKD
ncbi:DUF4169 family protein [Kozakia baliensis]|uniref:DUF4169 family protein n=1 Tax=Kozakia baliensis TaxID=153496 RepID=UPI000497DE3F|nr:DUF4169 family protein [Kozakia baliensis]AOX19349.1 hypothetical protein A0U90_02520 [Kozakia baliensis]